MTKSRNGVGISITDYNRIVIWGNNGSGKSYLAQKLHIITGLPLVHLDNEFWRPNWGMPSQSEWKARNLELVAGEKWIIDGNVNHGDTMALRYAAADLVIFLDINRVVCLARVISRNGNKRADTSQYRYEKFDGRFLRLCLGILNYRKTRRRIVLDLHEKYPEVGFLRIGSIGEVPAWLGRWGRMPEQMPEWN